MIRDIGKITTVMLMTMSFSAATSALERFDPEISGSAMSQFRWSVGELGGRKPMLHPLPGPSLGRKVHVQWRLAAAPTSPSPPQASQDAVAANFWATIRDSQNPALFEEFLQRFPDHALAPVARATLDSLRSQAAATQQPMHPASGGASGLAEQDLALALQTALQGIGCYTSGVDGDWGRGSKAAMERFNALAGTRFAHDQPSSEALAGVQAWQGAHCPVVATRPGVTKSVTRNTKPRTSRKKAPAKTAKKPSSGGGSIGVIIGGGRGGIGVGIGY